MTSVLVVDNHEVVRRGLRTMLESNPNLNIVGEATDGGQAIRLAETLSPDVIIMDVRMPKVDGVTACRRIRETRPESKILMLSIYDDDDDIFAAIDAGASGFMIKDTTSEDLAKVIEIVADGYTFFHPIVAQKIADRFRHVSEREKRRFSLFGSLTRREIEILEHLGRGRSNSEIASDLYISEATVKSHISNLLRKLDRHDRTQLALFAQENVIPHR